MAGGERGFWIREPGIGEIRSEPARDPGPGEVLVRTRWSGVSRGTELLVHGGRVPPSERARMRAPFQEGELPGPVKYGYLNVGIVEQGPAPLLGRTVFALAPHQTASVLPVAAVVPVPAEVPPRRAVLAGVVETALNALWDVPPLIGDRITVVGGGLIGSCVARLAVRQPATAVTVVDIDPARAGTAAALGARFGGPDDAEGEQDVVYHASGTGAGLDLALTLVRTEGTVAELSWYGDVVVAVHLGGDFHARRLTIASSQVGLVAPARRGVRTPHDRLALALELLRDPAFDALLAPARPFDELPALLAEMARGRSDGLCQLIEYGGG
ncbi:zinc-binding alcohol dehydrogenase [Amnibacterium sp. CER49]|uniref:zinc-dependent alcohol dehydrogenase n=1 Tax=Amnibacterium sp. CER49 TaxID=3039161 RepID=UPI00244B7CFB|nr:zinc-binding alcohol dehydrogenase [Amnibacterium sp. CER49]MDH2443762.1 zinc-binding alcohol dehydrogenase [Amnibacterium sp. CER49]